MTVLFLLIVSGLALAGGLLAGKAERDGAPWGIITYLVGMAAGALSLLPKFLHL